MNHALPNDLEDIALQFFEELATPLSLSVAILLRYKEYDQLAVKQIDPNNYLDAERYFADVSACSLLRKLEDLPTTFDRKSNAVKSFFESEASCYAANERLSPFLHIPRGLWGNGHVERIILSARKEIASILGRPPVLINGRFGPGATYGDRGRWTTVPDKMSSRPTLTSACIPFLFQWTGTAWASACADADRKPEFVRGNRFTTVPKDSTKFRGIAVEPSINLFYQLGLGRAIRSRLLRVGLDLTVGEVHHKQVACEASIKGHFATIDLSSASDTICRNLVKLLLPPDWYFLLDSLRSPTTFVDGRIVRLEKFSSMGNGYTFELETLIFLGLCLSVGSCLGEPLTIWEDVFVYGDDIIVPTSISKAVLSVLRYFGMTPNKRKTFIQGPFRESCGGDFFNGEAVRPHFLEESPHEPQHFIALANGLRRACLAESTTGRFDRIRRTWFRILDRIPNHIRRLRGPEDLGDLLIHDSQEFWISRTRSSIRYLRVYRPARFRKVSWKHFRPEVVLASAVYGTGDGAIGSVLNRSEPLGVTPRDSVLGYKVGWVPFS